MPMKRASLTTRRVSLCFAYPTLPFYPSAGNHSEETMLRAKDSDCIAPMISGHTPFPRATFAYEVNHRDVAVADL